MSKVILSTSMTVDALVDVGDWFVPEGGHDAAAFEVFEQSEAMLLGRKTYEGLAGQWATAEGPWAEQINPMPKYVASRTLKEPLEWNAKLIEGDAADGVRKLKETLDGDLFMSGCGELARYLAANELIDRFDFWVHPSVGGPGTRPFEGEKLRLQLVESKAFDSGVTLLRYAPASG